MKNRITILFVMFLILTELGTYIGYFIAEKDIKNDFYILSNQIGFGEYFDYVAIPVYMTNPENSFGVIIDKNSLEGFTLIDFKRSERNLYSFRVSLFKSDTLEVCDGSVLKEEENSLRILEYAASALITKPVHNTNTGGLNFSEVAVQSSRRSGTYSSLRSLAFNFDSPATQTEFHEFLKNEPNYPEEGYIGHIILKHNFSFNRMPCPVKLSIKYNKEITYNLTNKIEAQRKHYLFLEIIGGIIGMVILMLGIFVWNSVRRLTK